MLDASVSSRSRIHSHRFGTVVGWLDDEMRPGDSAYYEDRVGDRNNLRDLAIHA